MKQIGQQIRISIEESNYQIDFENDFCPPVYKDWISEMELVEIKMLILRNRQTRQAELWIEQDDYSGLVIEVDGVGYSFVKLLG